MSSNVSNFVIISVECIWLKPNEVFFDTSVYLIVADNVSFLLLLEKFIKLLQVWYVCMVNRYLSSGYAALWRHCTISIWFKACELYVFTYVRYMGRNTVQL